MSGMATVESPILAGKLVKKTFHFAIVIQGTDGRKSRLSRIEAAILTRCATTWSSRESCVSRYFDALCDNLAFS